MLILRLLTLLLTSVNIQVDLLDGSSISGDMNSIDPETVTLITDGQQQSIPLANVIGVTFPAAEPGQSPAAESGKLILDDGSRIVASLTTLTAQNAEAQSTFLNTINMPRTAIRAVQLGEANPDWDDAWQEYLRRDNQDDLLILKKRDGSGLDFYGGVISTASEDTIEFVLDGDTVPVPRTRVYGLIFGADEAPGNSPLVVQLTDGTEIPADRVTADGSSLQIRTSWEQTVDLPLAGIRSIDFSRGRFHYLSDLDPVKETYFGTHPKGSLLEELLKADDVLGEEAQKLWRLHRDQVPMGPFGPLPLTLRGRVYRKGLWLFPHCRIDYALDGRYSALQTVAGVDDEVAFNCSDGGRTSKVQLTILADGDPVWEQLIDAPADPVTIQLDVSGVRTLSLVVDFGDDDSACDFLDLADARLLLVP